MSKQYILELCAISTEALQDKLKISPIGDVTGLDGRVFEIDGQQVLDKLNATGLELVLNIAHSYDGEAAGWFNDFELRDDGIYAMLSLNDNGQDLIAKKHYKYLSPEYFKDYDTNQVHMLVGVGLVNQPNLLNGALNQISSTHAQEAANSQENPMADQGNTQLDDLQTQINQLMAEKDALAIANAELAQQVHANKVDATINQGKLAPAKRDFALELDANALDKFLDVEAATFKATDDNHMQPDNLDDGAPCVIAQQYEGA